MFYLGSISGILPYFLALCLTLVWGGHAGLPLFTSSATSQPNAEVSEEKKLPMKGIKSFIFEKQVVAKKITVFVPTFCPKTTVFNLFLFLLIYSPDLGISLLRAPPVSLF